METLKIPAWRAELTNRRAPVLEIQPGQKVNLIFRNEGEEFLHPNGKFKKAVVFSVYVEGLGLRRWFVRSQKVLNRIYELGATISGLKVEVEREGKGLETSYRIAKVQ